MEEKPMGEMRCNGIRIAYEQSGHGSPVTLIHGLTVNSKVWESHAERLSARHRVLTYDLRGHGQSEKPADHDFSFAAHAKDLLDLLDGLGIQKTALVGWSLGASVATCLAAIQPHRVSKLILIAGTPMLIARPDFPYAVPPQQQAAMVGMAQQDFTGFMKAFRDMMLVEPHDPELAETLAAMALEMGKDVYIAIMQQTVPIDIRPVIAAVKVPTLVLHGSLDVICPPPAGQHFADHIAGATWHPIEGAGHAMLLTRPEAVHTAIAGFLA
jgi:pimeloyl-[acyl-carrier protein] methyl ester esterase